MIKFGERRLLETYVNDYMREFKEVIAENPKQRILLRDKVDYRHPDECFNKGYFVQRGLTDVPKLPQVKKELEEKDINIL